jgi:glycosyltransferase involved in cell wall biosynthesis
VLGPPTAPLVVSVSRHDPRKGVDVLLAALAGLKKRGVPFRACIAGEGVLLETHRRLSVRSGLDGSTLVAGFVPDVWSLLAHADVFVLPSRREQSGSLALLEALQAGVAAVVSACDGIPEDVTDGEDALLVAPGDPVALEGALSRLLADQALRHRLARRGRETFERRFSAGAFSRDLGAVYREMGEP